MRSSTATLILSFVLFVVFLYSPCVRNTGDRMLHGSDMGNSLVCRVVALTWTMDIPRFASIYFKHRMDADGGMPLKTLGDIMWNHFHSILAEWLLTLGLATLSQLPLLASPLLNSRPRLRVASIAVFVACAVLTLWYALQLPRDSPYQPMSATSEPYREWPEYGIYLPPIIFGLAAATLFLQLRRRLD
jgi:hypothetical protein